MQNETHLCSDGMATRREQLSDTCRVEACFSKAKRSSQTCTSCTSVQTPPLNQRAKLETEVRQSALTLRPRRTHDRKLDIFPAQLMTR